MTREVEKNKNYFGISTKLAIAIESGSVNKEHVKNSIIAGVSPEKLLSVAVPVVPAIVPVVPAVIAEAKAENTPDETPKAEDSNDDPFQTNDEEQPIASNAELFSAMRLVDLKSYAKEHGVVIKSSDSKEDIVAAIVASVSDVKVDAEG